MPGFQLKYPADKPYPWPYFTPIVLALAVVCFAGLAVLNGTWDFPLPRYEWLDHV
jgi:hypothetical protein